MKKTKKIHEELTKMRELLAERAYWTSGDFAKDEAGTSVRPTSSKAVCWCLLGASQKVAVDFERGCDTDQYLASLLGEVPDENGVIPCDEVSDFNGRSTHAQVLALLDQAIKEPIDDDTNT